MKLVTTILVLMCVYINAQSVNFETTFQNDEPIKGVSVQRFQLNSEYLNIKYDYKAKTIEDVLGVFSPNINIGNNTLINFGVVKLGDWKDGDEILLDASFIKNLHNWSFSINFGHGEKNNLGSRDYLITTIKSALFSGEFGFVSQYNYKTFFQLTKNKYYWLSFHPEHLFIAIGNEVEKSWLLFGTKNMEGFGNFTFLNIDRNNDNFWFRTQFGYKNINKYFYSLENYRIATSYLVVPPFFYKHFSPIASKGDYAFKIDGKRVGSVEVWEVVGAKNLGDVGRITFGWQKEGKNNGAVVEYYKDFVFERLSLITELRYEKIYNRISGFITTTYNF